MKNINVTILPWRVFCEPREGDLHPLVSICRDDERHPDLVCNHCTPEDAKFICQAANEHDPLDKILTAVNELRAIMPLEPHQLDAYMAATFLPAVREPIVQIAKMRKK